MKANVGMQYAVAAPITAYTPGTTPTYGNGYKVCEARGANISWDRGDGEFYGDDVLLDVDNSVRSGSIEFETAGIRDAIRANMLGETVANIFCIIAIVGCVLALVSGCVILKMGREFDDKIAVLAEGDAADRDDIKYLAPLPLFNKDGSIKQ